MIERDSKRETERDRERQRQDCELNVIGTIVNNRRIDLIQLVLRLFNTVIKLM